MNTLQAGQMFLEAERALEVAKQAKAQAEEILKEAITDLRRRRKKAS